MNFIRENDKLTIEFEGRIDSGNSADIESEIFGLLAEQDPACIVLDAEKLDYISSAGLRVLLATQKGMRAAGGSLTIVNAVPAVREVFDITGFSDILTLA